MITVLALIGSWLGGSAGLAAPHLSAGSLAPDGAVANLAAGAQGWAQAPPVRIWLEEATDLFYPGDPVRLRFRTEDDAYVAVFHVDTDGRIDLLYPRSSLDQQIVAGRRTHSLSARMDRFELGRTPGIGYFYVVAAPYPLDLRAIGVRSGRWSGGGLVRGDPFWALEELTQALVRDWRYAVDVYSYHVGGRHRYPSYACYDARDRRIQSSHAYYPSCDRLRRLLVTYPYYYDTRRYRGDRAPYLRELHDVAPPHGFKEPVGRQAPPLRVEDPRRPDVRGRGAAQPPPVAPERREPRAEPAAPARQRPTLERRSRPSEPERREPAPARESPPPQRSEPPRARPAPSEPAPRERPPERRAPESRPSPPPQSPPARERPRPEPQTPAEPPPRAAAPDPAM